jgi:hypothetical protein
MQSGVRIKVLERLALSHSPAAEGAIKRACDEAIATLAEQVEYGALEFSLQVLQTVGFRRSKDAVAAADTFLRSVEQRKLVHAAENGELFEALSKYRSAHRLMTKAIELLSTLRYLETPTVVESLLWASTHADESVRKTAFSDLSSVAEYNISVYFGNEARGGIGATPQIRVVDALEGKGEDYLRPHLRGVLTLLEGLLSTSMESTRWSSSAVTLSQTVTPAHEEVVNVRKRAIAMLRRLYGLVAANGEKRSVIQTMNSAARGDGRGAVDKEFAEMISSDAQEVLRFFGGIAKEEGNLQIIQKVEHDAYWIHFHSTSEDVRQAALEVKAIIDANAEYSIYKTLIGFEGIFGDWSKDRRDESYALGSQESRQRDGKVIASQVETQGFDVWRARILRFAETESNDLATFPVFYEFLAEVATLHPGFALELLSQETEPLSRFLIPLLRGVWHSNMKSQLLLLMTSWIDETRAENTTALNACAKVFLSTKDVDFGILQKILGKATELRDVFVIRQIASVAVGRSSGEEGTAELRALFLKVLPRLTELGDAGWVREIWYRKEAIAMVAEFSPTECRKVLENLQLLLQIDYQAEDVLAAIAERDPQAVVQFLCDRLYRPPERVAEKANRFDSDFEGLPYQFHTLQDSLSKEPAMVVAEVLKRYSADDSLFEFRGAKLLQAIFPQFPEGLHAELVRLVSEGSERELEFVVGVLRAFEGEVFIQPVAKEVIKRLPRSSPLVGDVAIALRSTGVVSGLYGMAESYDRKGSEVLEWIQDPNERIRTFATKYVADLKAMSDSERRRADEASALRKFEYGED